jgi:hypothetical protein
MVTSIRPTLSSVSLPEFSLVSGAGAKETGGGEIEGDGKAGGNDEAVYDQKWRKRNEKKVRRRWTWFG